MWTKATQVCITVLMLYNVPCMDFFSDTSSRSNSRWMRSSMAAFTGSQLTVMQSTFSWLPEDGGADE